MRCWPAGIVFGLAAWGAAATPALSQAPARPSVVPQSEHSDVAVLKPMGAHWVITSDPDGPMRIFDTDDGRMQGEAVNYDGNFAIGPLAKYFFTSETFYAHRNRGPRDDVLTIWDAATLNLVKEIEIPGRMIVDDRVQNFQVSADGSHAYVYNMMPSSSVIVVDLAKRQVEQTLELPGCADIFVNPKGGFYSLCSNGSLADVSFAGGKGTIVRSKPFFDAAGDPIFDNSVSNPKTGRATFLTYSGLIYQGQLGAGVAAAKPWSRAAAKPWSIQEAAGMKKAEAAPLAVAWYPGGAQPFAVHQSDNRIYVLMHAGDYWTHTQSGTDVWLLDGNSHKLIRRAALPGKIVGGYIQVTQDADPKVIVAEGDHGEPADKILVLDGNTLEEEREIDHAGAGPLFVRP